MKSQKSTWRRTGRCGWCGAKRKHKRDNYLCDRCDRRREVAKSQPPAAAG